MAIPGGSELNIFVSQPTFIKGCIRWLINLRSEIIDYNILDMEAGGHTNLPMGIALDAYLFSLIKSLRVCQRTNANFPFADFPTFQKTVIAEINQIFVMPNHIIIPLDHGYFSNGGKLFRRLAENVLNDFYEQKVPEEKRIPINLLSLAELRKMWEENAKCSPADKMNLHALFNSMAQPTYITHPKRMVFLEDLWQLCNIGFYMATDENYVKFLINCQNYIRERIGKLARYGA